MGLFGGGRRQTTTQTAQVSPAQERLITALTPIQIEEAGLQLGLAQQGVPALTEAVAGAEPALMGALELSSAETGLPGEVGRVSAPLGGAVSASATDLLGPIPGVILDPLIEALTEDVLPAISSASIRAGAPGGSVEQDLTTRAVRGFGRAATGELARSAAERTRAGATAAPIAQALSLAGPRAAADVGAQERGLATRRAGVPIELAQTLLSASQGIPVVRTPFAPPSATARTQTRPSVASDVGSALETALLLGLLFG